MTTWSLTSMTSAVATMSANGWAIPMGWRIGDRVPADGLDYHTSGFGSDNEDCPPTAVAT